MKKDIFGFLKKRKNPFPTTVIPNSLHKNLDFTATEQYKALRTNLQFTIPEEVKCPIIGVTSSTRGEGKSTTSINLAYVMAESDKKVLLIDGDLRIPSIAKKMGISNDVGVTDYLIDKKKEIPLSSMKSNVLDNWYIMTSGELPPNPSELLGSNRMGSLLAKLSEHFDCIIVDLPPVNLVTDAVAISRHITGIVVVVREGYADKKGVAQCFRQLDLSGVKRLGCVITGSKSDSSTYGKYKKYKYYYTSDKETAED